MRCTYMVEESHNKFRLRRLVRLEQIDSVAGQRETSRHVFDQYARRGHMKSCEL